MSDEDEDYISSDDSEEESTKTPANNSSGNNNSNNKTTGKPAATGLLSLIDNDNDYDASMFTRPDLANFDDECGESEDELSGESEGESEFGNKKRTKKKVQTSKANNRQSKFSYNSDQDEAKKNNLKKKKKKQIGICVEATKYDCVRRVGRKLGFKEVAEQEDWSVFWTDLSVSIDRVNQMKRWQVLDIILLYLIEVNCEYVQIQCSE